MERQTIESNKKKDTMSKSITQKDSVQIVNWGTWIRAWNRAWNGAWVWTLTYDTTIFHDVDLDPGRSETRDSTPDLGNCFPSILAFCYVQ